MAKTIDNITVSLSIRGNRVDFNNLTLKQSEALSEMYDVYSTAGIRRSATLNTFKTSWNKEEIKQLIFRAYNLRTEDKTVRSTKELNKWIEENL